jgi:hypothetical protein
MTMGFNPENFCHSFLNLSAIVNLIYTENSLDFEKNILDALRPN